MQMGIETLHPKYYNQKIKWPKELHGKPYLPAGYWGGGTYVTYTGRCPTKDDKRCKVNPQQVLFNPQTHEHTEPEPWIAARLADSKYAQVLLAPEAYEEFIYYFYMISSAIREGS